VKPPIWRCSNPIQCILRGHKAFLRERLGVHRLAVFGSYARGEATPVSDVDIFWGLRPNGPGKRTGRAEKAN